MSIQPYVIFNSGDGIQTAFAPESDYDTGWLQVVPGMRVCVSLAITEALTGTLDDTTLTLYGSGSDAEDSDGVQIAEFTETPTASTEILWKADVGGIPYIRVKWVSEQCSGGEAVLLITRI